MLTPLKVHPFTECILARISFGTPRDIRMTIHGLILLQFMVFLIPFGSAVGFFFFFSQFPRGGPAAFFAVKGAHVDCEVVEEDFQSIFGQDSLIAAFDAMNETFLNMEPFSKSVSGKVYLCKVHVTHEQ